MGGAPEVEEEVTRRRRKMKERVGQEDAEMRTPEKRRGVNAGKKERGHAFSLSLSP
jgi:hypothetical protein